MIVAIIGVGQIGGSLSAALRKRDAARIVEIGRKDDLADVKMGDVVVLSTPSRTIIELMPKVVPLMRAKTVLTDVGSVKGPIVEAYRKHRRRDIAFVPGHPMAGTEDKNLRDPDLFVGKKWLTIGTDPRVDGMIKAVGSIPTLVRTAGQHDAMVAAVSHLPHAIALALLELAGDHADVAGSSFRDATRVLLSDARMVSDFMTLNRAALKDAVTSFVQALKRIPELNPEAFEERWEAGKKRRKSP